LVQAVAVVIAAVWAVASFASDSRQDVSHIAERVTAHDARIDRLEQADQAMALANRDVMEKITNRLTALETQSGFIAKSVQWMESELRRQSVSPGGKRE
jgi:hypothetical protein